MHTSRSRRSSASNTPWSGGAPASDEGFAKVAQVATLGMEIGFGLFQGLGALALGIDDRNRVPAP